MIEASVDVRDREAVELALDADYSELTFKVDCGGAPGAEVLVAMIDGGGRKLTSPGTSADDLSCRWVHVFKKGSLRFEIENTSDTPCRVTITAS